MSLQLEPANTVFIPETERERGSATLVVPSRTKRRMATTDEAGMLVYVSLPQSLHSFAFVNILQLKILNTLTLPCIVCIL